MNRTIKKTIAYIGHWGLNPFSKLMPKWESSLSAEKAKETILKAYNLDQEGLSFVGG